MSRVVPIWLLAASVACAQEVAPTSAGRSSAPTEDAIAAAKRDFNAIKSAKGALDQPKADLPSLTAPELQTTTPTPRPLSSSKVDPKAAKKSENWLVDAMMKPDETASTDPRERLGDPAKRDREGVAVKNSRGAADPHVAAGKDEDSQLAEKRVGPEFNPLARYMAGWMTPQDYALLKPGLDGSAAASLTSRGDPSLPAVGADLSVLGDAGSALDLAREPKGTHVELPKQSENPFLQSFNANSASPATSFTPPPAMSSPVTPSTFSPARVDVAPAKSKIPDFAKPATDEKYFKQLKRF